MAQKIDYSLPFNDLTKYIPRELRNPVNVGLIDNLFNRFMTRDESVPLFGYVGRKPTSLDDTSPRIAQPSVERDINAVIPVMSFKLGSETIAFTVQDLINKAKALGIDTDDLSWLYSQGNSFRPPINFDKFTNFFNYYWVGTALPSIPDLPWNFEALPEYYVIAPPQLTDLDKLNVMSATGPGENLVLTGSGFIDQQFILTFTTPTTFTVTTTAPLTGPSGVYTPTPGSTTITLPAVPVAPQAVPVDIVNTYQFIVTGPAGAFTLVEYTITRAPLYDSLNAHIGYTDFQVGDVFTIDTTYLSSNYSISFSGVSSSTRAAVGPARALNAYQLVGGYQVEKGDRVLIKNQTTLSENGIYVVSEQGWSRATDFDTTTAAAGARTFVRNGVHANQLWTSAGGPVLFSWSQVPGVTESNTNDWQEGNFWVKGDDLAALGFSDSTTLSQAVRPIIEYNSTVQLNTFVDANGRPGSGVANFKQEKTEFNQLPLFDLFRYDGTHSGLVSSIFYYVEDLTAAIDLVLQKRVKISENDSADFIFNHGCVDTAGQLLFFKENNELHTVWHAGYLGPEIVDYSQQTVGTGTITGLSAGDITQQQVWTAVAMSPTTFEVAASKMPLIPSPANQVTVGVPYDNGDIAFTINAGLTPFAVGDTFIIRVGNLERPRYVFRAADDSVQDFYGGKPADTTGIGAYQVTRTFYNNPYNEIRSELTEGSVFTHFRGVLKAQPEGLPLNYAFGGSIMLWSEQQTLLAAILMQKDLTLASMIDMAKRQYETGLNSINDIYTQKIVEYFANNEVVDSDGTPQETAKANTLLEYVLELRSVDNDVRTVLYDTTAGVIGFPATLPQLGLMPLVEPTVVYDLVLGLDVLVHHDGHKSALFVDNQQFRDTILGNYTSKLVLRSDGLETPAIGSFTASAPVNPYKGLLWMRPTAGGLSEILAFDVNRDDATTPPSPGIGQLFSDLYPAGTRWYNRSSLQLFESDGFSWVLQPTPSVAWKVVNLADTINELLFITEQRLYARINPDQRIYDFSSVLADVQFQEEMKRELFNFAALNGLDPLATNYSPSNSFTWNYSQAVLPSFPPLATPAVPARWYDALMSHQQTVAGVLPTQRPDVEPWKLFGFSTYATWWASLAPVTQAAYTPGAEPAELSDGTFVNAGNVRAVKTDAGATPLTGLQTIDGVALQPGNLVLLQNESAPANNGLWVVSASTWSRPLLSLTFKMYVTVTEGSRYANTRWFLSAPVPVINVSPVLFSQVRVWTETMWADAVTARPLLRLSVSPWTGEILPPYVSSASATSIYALTTTIPTGIAMPFQFGEGSPVEEVWERSIEYNYALVKALSRFDPLALIGFAWGFNWVSVDDILYDGFDISMPGHKRFRLHGEAVTPVARTTPITLASATGTAAVDVTLTYDAYDTNRKQSFSIRDTATQALLGTTIEGVTSTLALSGVTLTGLRIEDGGIPFRSGDSFRITATAAGVNLTTTFSPMVANRILGLGQTFTNALREISVDTTSSFAIAAFREWDVNMGYRAGGLVSTDDLLIFTENQTLNPSSFSLQLKKNAIAKDMWLQALRVTVTQYGTMGEVPPSKNGPQYRSTQASDFPAGVAADWVFRVEGYNPRFSGIEYYTLQSTPSGLAFPLVAPINSLFFRHDLGETFIFDGSTWNVTTNADLVTFNALTESNTNLTWYQPKTVVGTVSSFLPITITGLQNLVNFLFGYAQFTEDDGWRFNTANEFNIDAETGRHRNWQLEIEKLIDRVYGGIQLGQGHILNPFLDRVWVQQDTGMLAHFKDTALFDVTGDAGVFDVLGVRFEEAALRPLRGNLISSIGANAPMYSVHAQLDEFEHLFIFNNWVDESTDNGLLYDPFSGARTVTYKFNGRKQGSTTFRPEFGGYYIVGNEVRQNPQASTDNIENAYDANKVFENTTVSKHALTLLGFSTKSYFDDLDISDKTQFNFWRGLIQAKGTNMSIDAYLNSNRFQVAEIDEYWAYKLAEYGDSRQKTYPEMHIQAEDTLQQYTQLQFDAQPGFEIANFTQISRFDETRWFSIDDLDQDAYFKAESVGTFLRTFTALETYPMQVTLPFIADALTTFSVVGAPGSAAMLNSTVMNVIAPCTVTVVGYGPATPRYNPMKIFNFVEDQLIEEIPHWHPAIEQHTPTALENINIISMLDPARYNFSTLVQGNNNIDPLRPWGDKEIGRVWFDTRNLKYVPYYDTTIFPNRGERLSRWGALTDYATVDVYEWVKSEVAPSDYAALAAVQALDADIPASQRASGEVALQQTYYRDRSWFIRPIAWSQTGTLLGGHPSFNGSFNSKLFIDGTTYSLEIGSFAERGITVGMRIGAWDPNPIAPQTVSEAIVLETKKTILYSGSAFPLAGVVQGDYTIDLTSFEYTDALGQFVFAAVANNPIRVTTIDGVAIDEWETEIQLRVIEVGTGREETITLDTVVGTQLSQPAIPASSGYQEVTFGPNKIDSDPTGLTFTHTATISINGVATPISVASADATTFGELISEINSQLAGAPVQFNADGNIVVTSSTTGPTSTVLITDVDLFSQLNDFNALGTPVAGVAGQPAIPADSMYGATITLAPDQVLTYDSPLFGLRIAVTVGLGGTVPGDEVRNAIATALAANIYIRDSITVEEILDTSVLPLPNILSNDPNDAESVTNNGVGWTAWTIPTQTQLNNDGRQPLSTWRAYPGSYRAFSPSATQLTEAITYDAAPLTLNDGTVISRYSTEWQDWQLLSDVTYSATAVVSGPVTFTHTENVDSTRTTIYVNGLAQLKASYTIIGPVITITNVPAGNVVHVIIRKFSPSTEQLAFDPSVADNLTFQRQYKLDYQYVSLVSRDADGSVSTTYYYFWVRNRSVPANGKKLSVQATAQLLREGPPSYLNFQIGDAGMLGTDGSVSDPLRYDAIALSGLSFLVTKNDTFKLRFTRNFTLRDDPEGIDLKNTHTEWGLIRTTQKSRIPESLWNKLVDSMAGQDVAGNVVPSLRRVLYDERTGGFTQFGFNDEQTLAPADLLKTSVEFTILNTRLVDNSSGVPVPDFIAQLDFSQSDSWFSTPENCRITMTTIWTEAKVSQINEIFFAALQDILASNLELTDIFKTSRLSAYSIRTITGTSTVPTYE